MAAPIKAGYLATPLGQVHYYYSAPVTAPSTPKSPMLLMHMSASSAKSFLKMMPMLTALGYTCYAPDMPGFGSSFDPAEDPPSISWYASLYYEAFTSQVPDFKEGRGVHIIGHHSGGILGMEFASNPDQYPGFVRSLTIVGASVMTAADRAEMSKTFLSPFNKPVASGEHLQKTWDYLKWEGLNPDVELELVHREALDHARAWKGRNQIYSCVWKYERMEALDAIPADVKVAGLCAPDDVLWPYYGNFKALVTRHIETTVIKGGNFGPDLDPEGILDAFLRLIGEK